jgi:pimeloyl-ACP methyl ester carboxylesterase
MENDSSSSVLITHGFASVNGLRLHYAESGRGDLVILLHGFPEFWYSWRHQLAALSAHHHVVAPDLRGYNLSDKPSRVEEYQIDVMVDDVIGLIDHFGAGKASVVAHDWGAGIAWAIAQKHPERLSKLAVMQVPPAAVWRANMSVRQLLQSWYMFFFMLPRLPEWLIRRNNFAALDGVFKDQVVRAGSFSDDDIEKYKAALREPGALTAAVNYYRANVFRLMRRKPESGVKSAGGITGGTIEKDRRIRVPTLFIFAEQDSAILPKTVKGVANYFDAPYLELRIPDCGHWVQNEAPDEVNTALIKFLATD